MDSLGHISTGHPGMDAVVDGLRLGDNVVWQVDTTDAYTSVATHFMEHSLRNGRRVVYIRFGDHPPLVGGVDSYTVDPSTGFESFAAQVHHILTDEGLGVFYVFDSLTTLLDTWGSDLMVMNFFKVTCPYLYELDTIAYFALIRARHSSETIASIRETTQLLLDLHLIDDTTYLHAHKVWNRYSPTMFFPHRVEAAEAIPVTSSAESSELFGKIGHQEPRRDAWRFLLERANDALESGNSREQNRYSHELTGLLIGRDGRMVDLASAHLSLADLLRIAQRRIGSGRLGGKSVGMVVAGAIVQEDPTLAARLEPTDSFFLGSDLFFTYLIECGWWRDWMEQKTSEGYYPAGERLHRKLRHGQFPPVIRERFMRLLEYFGQSPIIVRSSSLLEDNFGNAFSGKYESVFCANQGDPEQRLRAFEEAVRIVYASVMSHEALAYREHRGLGTADEQMAVLVQRVSGDHHGRFFFPDAAGVGNSHNLYVFNRDIDPEAGALRLVVGLGTRAVDRLSNDYAKIVALDHPLLETTSSENARRYSQHLVDVLDLQDNKLREVALRELEKLPLRWDLFLSRDRRLIAELQERGRPTNTVSRICDFTPLLHSEFPVYMRRLLSVLESNYDYPVDIEFTINTTRDGDFRVCLLQCRPLQTRGVGTAVAIPEVSPTATLLRSRGGFMGGNLDQEIDAIIFVRPGPYLALTEQQRFEVAREIGHLNHRMDGLQVAAIGPGRWGSSTTTLGVPVHFAEINKIRVLIETTEPELGFNVELSFGSHFFQDLVESGIFFIALDQMNSDTQFNSSRLLELPNALHRYLPDSDMGDVIHVADTPGLRVYADVLSQQVVAAFTSSP